MYIYTESHFSISIFLRLLVVDNREPELSFHFQIQMQKYHLRQVSLQVSLQLKGQTFSPGKYRRLHWLWQLWRHYNSKSGSISHSITYVKGACNSKRNRACNSKRIWGRWWIIVMQLWICLKHLYLKSLLLIDLIFLSLGKTPNVRSSLLRVSSWRINLS